MKTSVCASLLVCIVCEHWWPVCACDCACVRMWWASSWEANCEPWSGFFSTWPALLWGASALVDPPYHHTCCLSTQASSCAFTTASMHFTASPLHCWAGGCNKVVAGPRTKGENSGKLHAAGGCLLLAGMAQPQYCDANMAFSQGRFIPMGPQQIEKIYSLLLIPKLCPVTHFRLRECDLL